MVLVAVDQLLPELLPRVSQKKKKTCSFSFCQSRWALTKNRTDQNIDVLFFFPGKKKKPECLDGLAAFQFSPQNKIKTNGKSSYLWNAKHPAGPTGLTVGLWVDVRVVLLVS